MWHLATFLLGANQQPYWPGGVEASAAVGVGSYTAVSVAASCTGGGGASAGTEEPNVWWASTCIDDAATIGY